MLIQGPKIEEILYPNLYYPLKLIFWIVTRVLFATIWYTERIFELMLVVFITKLFLSAKCNYMYVKYLVL